MRWRAVWSSPRRKPVPRSKSSLPTPSGKVALLEQGRKEAAAAADAAMKKAEEAAAGRRKEILAQAEKDCEKLKADARKRMDKATQAILGRVVES